MKQSSRMPASIAALIGIGVILFLALVVSGCASDPGEIKRKPRSFTSYTETSNPGRCPGDQRMYCEKRGTRAMCACVEPPDDF